MNKLVVFILSIFVSTFAIANSSEDLSPYVGIKYKFQYAKGKDDYGKFFPKNYNNGGIFLGLKFHENFAGEVGYTQSLKRSAEHTFSGGETLFGDTVAANATIKTKITMKNYYLDLLGYYPIDNDWSVLASLGMQYSKPKVTDASDDSFDDVKMKGKWVPRVGLGAEYKYENWGFRAKALWENISRLKIADIDSNQKCFKDSLGVVLGVAYYF